MKPELNDRFVVSERQLAIFCVVHKEWQSNVRQAAIQQRFPWQLRSPVHLRRRRTPPEVPSWNMETESIAYFQPVQLCMDWKCSSEVTMSVSAGGLSLTDAWSVFDRWPLYG